MTTAIGLIGTENSHAEHFIRFLNQEQRYPGFRATVLAGGANERNTQLAEAGGITGLVEAPAELIGQADAAIISSRDGAAHRAEAEPLIAAGIPVLVDKPLATSIADADALIAQAEAAGTLLFSASALRSLPETRELAERATAHPVRHLHVAGAGDANSPYAGLFYYGIHHIEAALEILGRPEVDEATLQVAVRRSGGAIVADVVLGEVPVTFTFVPPRADGQLPFHITAVDDDAVTARTLEIPRDYNEPTLSAFITALETGQAPLSADEMRAPVVVMDRIVAAL